MNLTLCGPSALRLLRALRSDDSLSKLTFKTCDLKSPHPGESGRWSARSIARALERFGEAGIFFEKSPLHVVVSSRDERLRVKGVINHVRTIDVARKAYVDLGGGIAMSGPELLYCELASSLDEAVHLLLGMELCGCFSRSPIDPLGGPVRYGISPVAHAHELREFARAATGLRGARVAARNAKRIVENAWSPREAVLAALLVLPAPELGYGLDPIELNTRVSMSERDFDAIASSRVPDILLSGTNVGLNYDGEDHFGLEALLSAGGELERNPDSAAAERALAAAKAEVRRRIIDDKRRDRDLVAAGYSVFSVTNEDLMEPGALDRTVLQAISVLESCSKRSYKRQRELLESGRFASLRQDFIWSLLPGKLGDEARARRAAELRQIPGKGIVVTVVW